jgi:ssDNA-specific exonuclease RecJ
MVVVEVVPLTLQQLCLKVETAVEEMELLDPITLLVESQRTELMDVEVVVVEPTDMERLETLLVEETEEMVLLLLDTSQVLHRRKNDKV